MTLLFCDEEYGGEEKAGGSSDGKKNGSAEHLAISSRVSSRRHCLLIWSLRSNQTRIVGHATKAHRQLGWKAETSLVTGMSSLIS